MRKERKICMPAYKLVYSVMFLVILSLIRGISFVYEIGIALQVNAALLAIVFCADTYETEFTGKRWEIFILLPEKSRVKVVYKRLLLQVLYLSLLSFAGYLMFYWQKPMNREGDSFWGLYGIFVLGSVSAILFWGLLSMTLVNLLHNLWAGIGGTLLLWMGINSTAGDEVLGKWNVFAFTFRNVDDIGNFQWLWGTGLAVLMSVILLAAVPWIIRKRGAKI